MKYQWDDSIKDKLSHLFIDGKQFIFIMDINDDHFQIYIVRTNKNVTTRYTPIGPNFNNMNDAKLWIVKAFS